MNKTISVIINNSIRVTPNGYGLADGGHEFINELVELGYDVNLIGLTQELNDSNFNNFLDSKVSIKSLSISPKPKSNNLIKVINYIYSFSKLLYLSLTNDKFYVYIPSNVSLITVILMLISGNNYGLYVRGTIVESRFDGKVRDWSILYKIYLLAIRKADFIIVTGQYLRNRLVGYNSNIQNVVPMMSISDKDLYYDKVFKKNNKLLFVGRIDKEKGVEEIVAASKILKENNYNFEFKLAGGYESSYFQKLQSMINEYGLRNEIKFLGRVSDKDKLKDLYKASDVFVFPSHHEGFPRVLYEAMTFSLPVVTTNLDTYEGIMENNKNCVMVDVNNPVQLATAIIDVLDSKKKRQKLTKESLELMSNFFKKIDSKSHATQVIQGFKA